MSSNGGSKPKSFHVRKKLNSSLKLGSKEISKPYKGVQSNEREEYRIEGDLIDEMFGFYRFREGSPRLGWLLNYLPITMFDDMGIEKSGIDLYFIDRGGQNFKASIFFEPYFYVDVADSSRVVEIAQHIPKRIEGCRVEIIDKQDLDMPNHLSGKVHRFLKLCFSKVSDLVTAKQILR